MSEQITERFVYLAGPITGYNFEDLVKWREHCLSNFPKWLKPLSPLRGKSYLKDLCGEKQIQDHYTNKILSNSKGITSRDRNDVIRADAILVNLLDTTKVSIGSVLEIAWVDMMRKPIIVVMQEGNVHWHSMIRESAGYVTPSLDEGIDVLIQVLGSGL